ncbi:MAG: O-antigen ligase family protein [Geobacteraceae bacterium]|nr:O-antigen ligase family protein [Geobacteraceae bacterium]
MRTIDISAANSVGHCGERPGWSRVLYLIPFFLMLFATTLSLKQNMGSDIKVFALQHGDPIRPYIFGPIYLLALILLICQATEALKMIWNHWLYVFFLLYVIATIGWSAHPGKVFVTWGHLVGGYLVCICALVGLKNREQSFFRMLAIFSFITIIITLFAVAFVPGRGIMKVGEMHRWVGFAPNANTLGMALLLSVWASVMCFLYAETVLAKLFAVVLLGFTAVCLFGSDSMTSSLLALLVVTLVPLFSFLAGKRLVLVLPAVILALSTIFAVVLTTYLVAPELFMPEKFFSLIGRTSTFTGRTTLWEIASRAIRERPLLGWAFDGRLSVSDKYLFHAGHFHNGYLEVLVSGGLTAMLFIAGMVGQMCLKLILTARRNARLFSGMGVMLLVILLHNITEASFGNSPQILWLIFTLMFLHTGVIDAGRGHLREETTRRG